MTVNKAYTFLVFILCIFIFTSMLPYILVSQNLLLNSVNSSNNTPDKNSPVLSRTISNNMTFHENMTTPAIEKITHDQFSIEKLSSTSNGNQANFTTTYILNSINTGIINSTRPSTTWILPNLTIKNQKVYFNIKFNSSLSQYGIITSVVNPDGQSPNVLQTNKNTSVEIDGNFIINTVGTWNLTIGASNTPISMSPSYYNLSIYIPTNGYSFDTAIQIADVANRLETSYNYSTKSLFETLYFNISVHAFQRFLLNVTETAPSITQDTSVSLYTPAGPFPPFPFIIDQTLQNGGIVLTWVPNGNVNSMWIVLSQGGLPENYTMVFSVQISGYSFDSAILVASNQTHLQWINFTDEWPTVLYYKFFINQTGIGTWVNISEKNSGSSLLTNAQVFIYAPNENYKVLQLNELNSPITGQITGNFTAMTSGYYYIVVSLGSSSTPIPSKEAYTILLLYTYPPVVPVQSFQWTFLNILLSFLILFVLPGVFFGIDMFVKPEPIQWHILLSGEVVYNAISKNPRFENKYEFPTESILFEPPYIGSYRLKFDKINDDETTLSLLGPQKTFLRYFYYLPIGFFAYFLINYLLYLSTNTTLLFFEVTDLLPFYLLLLICFVLVVPVSIFIVYRYNFIKRLIYEINYTKNDIVPNIDGPNLSLNLNALQKQFSYIRVVWNQAKKAFNEQNYSLFIIKADTAVKKLVETRYVQFVGSVRSKDFNTIIQELRLRGLDIPSNKKIEYFHQIRNKVVHTSHLLLDEKTAIETFNYYSKFLNRLGMRT